MAELITERELATLLKCSTKAIQLWRQQGSGPRFLKLNRLVRYDRAEVEKFLADSTISNTAQAGR